MILYLINREAEEIMHYKKILWLLGCSWYSISCMASVLCLCEISCCVMKSKLAVFNSMSYQMSHEEAASSEICNRGRCPWRNTQWRRIKKCGLNASLLCSLEAGPSSIVVPFSISYARSNRYGAGNWLEARPKAMAEINKNIFAR